jgi:hypothetical protein
MSAITAEVLRQLSDVAVANGQKDAFISALRHIDDRLQNDPIAFGEELFDLRHHRGVVKLAVRLPIAVEFGVFPEQRIVAVRSFRYVAPAR